MEFTGLSCREFVSMLASKEPVPGGGGAAALVGAVGVALGSMVGSLTIGKKKYIDVQDDIIALNAKAETLSNSLLELVQRDAQVFEPLSKAYGMPKDTDIEREEKDRVMEAALKDACSVPLAIMEKCCEVIELHKEYAIKGTAIAISDVGCGVICAKSALQAASLNVFINTKSMKDREYADKINIHANSMLEKYCAIADAIYDDVATRFK